MKVLLLNSGGPDSAMLAKKLKDNGDTIYSLYIDYKVKNGASAKIAAEETARRYCDSHQVISLELPYEANHYLPTGKMMSLKNEAMVIFSLGVSAGMYYGVDVVMSGHKQNLPEIYPMRFNEVSCMNRVAQQYPRPKLILPICMLDTYKAVMDWANVTNPSDFAYTVSCRYETPCGTCDKCLARQEVGIDGSI